MWCVMENHFVVEHATHISPPQYKLYIHQLRRIDLNFESPSTCMEKENETETVRQMNGSLTSAVSPQMLLILTVLINIFTCFYPRMDESNGENVGKRYPAFQIGAKENEANLIDAFSITLDSKIKLNTV